MPWSTAHSDQVCSCPAAAASVSSTKAGGMTNATFGAERNVMGPISAGPFGVIRISDRACAS